MVLSALRNNLSLFHPSLQKIEKTAESKTIFLILILAFYFIENLSLNMSNRRLDDNCWHLMEVSRRELQLKASINGT